MSASKTLRASMRQFYSRNNCLLPQQFPARTLPRLQPSISRQSPTIHSAHSFSTSSPLLARKQKGQKKDQRISIIRYHLQHPINPRPLRFSRSRHLRHWTIHRAWQLFRLKQRTAAQLTLERQYNSMRAACEALRLTGEDGLMVPSASAVLMGKGERKAMEQGREGLDLVAAAERQREVGKLFRVAMMKKWQGVPIEYARSQTETPPRAGWDHTWTR